MLRLVAGQAETLWDEALPVEVRELPQDLAALDGLLSEPALLAPFTAHWQREALVSGTSAVDHGRPTLAIETYVRLMVLRHRYGYHPPNGCTPSPTRASTPEPKAGAQCASSARWDLRGGAARKGGPYRDQRPDAMFSRVSIRTA